MACWHAEITLELKVPELTVTAEVVGCSPDLVVIVLALSMKKLLAPIEPTRRIN